MNTPTEGTGFITSTEQLGQERGSVAIASLVASAVLALCTIVAATVVSVGIARANAADSVIDNEGGLFAIALLLGLLFIGIGGIGFLGSLSSRGPRHRH